jgi:hypothetical protein
VIINFCLDIPSELNSELERRPTMTVKAAKLMGVQNDQMNALKDLLFKGKLPKISKLT